MASALPIVEAIAQEIALRLATPPVKDEQFQFAVRRRRKYNPESLKHLDCILRQGDPTPDEAGLGPFAKWRQPFEIILCVRPSESELDAMDALANEVWSEAALKVMRNRATEARDHALNGTCDTVYVRAPQYVHDERYTLVRIPLEAWYGTLDNDPYSTDA